MNPTQVQPGDMVLFSSNGQANGIHHVGVYLGDGRMVHAPETGDIVKVADDIWNAPYRKREFIGAVRAGSPQPLPVSLNAVGSPRGRGSRPGWADVAGCLTDAGGRSIGQRPGG
jgi:hypothetical protein